MCWKEDDRSNGSRQLITCIIGKGYHRIWSIHWNFEYSRNRGSHGSHGSRIIGETAGTGHAAVGASSSAKDIEPRDPIKTLNTAGTVAAMGATLSVKDIKPRASVGTLNTAGTGAAMRVASSAKKTTNTNRKKAAPPKTMSQKKQKNKGGNI